jgi:hypothetical protein
LRDNLKIGNDFPSHRHCDSIAQKGSPGLPGSQHGRPIHQAIPGPVRQGGEDNFQRGGLRHTPVALTVDKFGLNSAFGSSGIRVHSARCLHATTAGVAKFP